MLLTKTIIEGFLEQINEGNIKDLKKDYNWNKHFQSLFDWEEQEELISELVFTKIVNRYITYLTDIASYTIDKNEYSLDKKALLRNFPNIKKCYREHFNTPLYLTPEVETLADQLITIRNIIVHGLNYIPDRYYPKFQNWEELGCVRQDEDILFVKFDIRSLERFGLFFTKSVADIDTRLSNNHHLDMYYIYEEDITEEYKSYTESIDEEFSTEE